MLVHCRDRARHDASRGGTQPAGDWGVSSQLRTISGGGGWTLDGTEASRKRKVASGSETSRIGVRGTTKRDGPLCSGGGPPNDTSKTG